MIPLSLASPAPCPQKEEMLAPLLCLVLESPHQVISLPCRVASYDYISLGKIWTTSPGWSRCRLLTPPLALLAPSLVASTPQTALATRH